MTCISRTFKVFFFLVFLQISRIYYILYIASCHYLGLCASMHYQWQSIFFHVFMFSYVFQRFIITYITIKFNLNYINIVDMKRQVLIHLFISMLVGKKNEWSSYEHSEKSCPSKPHYPTTKIQKKIIYNYYAIIPLEI